MKLYFKKDLCENIFGWDCFLKYYPKLLVEGVEVVLKNSKYYITINNEIVHDTQFFTKEEVKDYCILKEET